MAKLRFKDTFKISECGLRIIRAHPDIPHNLVWAVTVILQNIVVGDLFLLMLNSAINHDIPRGDFAEACKNGSMGLIYLMVNVKYVVLSRYQKKLIAILNQIDSDYERTDNLSSNECEAIIKYAKKGEYVCRIWLLLASSIPGILILRAIVLMSWLGYNNEFKLVPMYDMTFPKGLDEIKYTPVAYSVILLNCLSFSVYLVSGFMGYEPYAPSIMMHTCGQLEIVRLRILNLFPKTNYNAEETRRRLRDIVVHLQEIYWLVDATRDTFALIYETVMKFVTVLLPLSAIQIIESLKASPNDIPLEFILFWFGCILQFYIPCYYSDILFEKGAEVSAALYACGWEQQWTGAPEKDLRARLLLVLRRSASPLGLRTVFRDVSLQAFAEMCQNGYLIFNVVNLMSK